MTTDHENKENKPQVHAVKLTTAGEKAIRSKHPWIFENSIAKLPDSYKAGDIAVIYDRKKNKYQGLGLLDPFSPIRIKMLVHHQKAVLNADWFKDKIERSLEIRKPLWESNTNSFRLVYGENDGLPGFICDVYGQVAVIKLYSHIWIPYLNFIKEAISSLDSISTIVLRLSRALEKSTDTILKNGTVIHGELTNETVVFTEFGIRFSANVLRGHKTGYFLDHRQNRHRVGQLADGKSVIDIFSYAGGFSVHALKGGATDVTSVDISKQALQLASKNVELNQDIKGKHSTIAGDAFDIMKRLAEANHHFDIVVVDPPSFAKKASEIDSALHSYRRLARLAIRLVASKGIIVLASCSSRISADEFFELNIQELEKSMKRFRVLDKTFHDIDHPVTFPEGAYLKCMYIQM